MLRSRVARTAENVRASLSGGTTPRDRLPASAAEDDGVRLRQAVRRAARCRRPARDPRDVGGPALPGLPAVRSAWGATARRSSRSVRSSSSSTWGWRCRSESGTMPSSQMMRCPCRSTPHRSWCSIAGTSTLGLDPPRGRVSPTRRFSRPSWGLERSTPIGSCSMLGRPRWGRLHADRCGGLVVGPGARPDCGGADDG